MLKAFLSRPDVSVIFDAMWAVTAAYAKPILVRTLHGFKQPLPLHPSISSRSSA